MITLLKCESCGASDFEKHKKMKDFLVCSCCGNQYLKPTKEIIDVELPVDLKVVIKSDMSTLEVNNAIIKGDMNNIKGNFNIVKGDMNTVKGMNNIARGDMNTVKNKKKQNGNTNIFKKFFRQ